MALSSISNTIPPISLKPRIEGLPKIFEDRGFKNFDDSKKYKFFKQRCIDFAKDRAEKSSLVLSGNVGTGKTHLAVAIMQNLNPVEKQQRISTNTVSKQNKYSKIMEPAKAQFLVVDEFFQELNDCAVNRESKLKVIERYLSENDLIVLDDLGVYNWSAAKQENLYLFVNRAYLDQKRIIITTNFTQEELEKKDERITSRLKEMAIFLEFKGEDFRK